MGGSYSLIVFTYWIRGMKKQLFGLENQENNLTKKQIDMSYDLQTYNIALRSIVCLHFQHAHSYNKK